MASVVGKVLTTVIAPYGADLSAHQLAAFLIDKKSADVAHGPSLAFFSEVSPKMQLDFITEMGLDCKIISMVATQFSKKVGYKLPLGE